MPVNKAKYQSTLCVRSRYRIFAVTLLLSAHFPVTPADAQRFERIAPQEMPEANTNHTIKENNQSTVQPSVAEIGLPDLKAIRLITKTEEILSAPSGNQDVELVGLPNLDVQEFKDLIKTHIGKPMSFDVVEDIKNQIIAYLRKQDLPLVDVTLPEQDISSGVLQIIVTEFRLGKLKLEGNQWFSDGIIEDGISAEAGSPIHMKQLEQDMNWLNSNPFRQVDVVLEKGEVVGTTDLKLVTKDELPMRAYAGYDNSGNYVTGRSRWNLGFNWGNALWQDHFFSYQFTSSTNFWMNRGRPLGNVNNANTVAHAISYTIPLPWRDKMNLFGSYGQSSPKVDTHFDQIGKSGQASFRYIHPLPVNSWLDHEIQIGYDYKITNSNLDFGGTSVFSSSSEVDQFLFVYKGNASNIWGQLQFQNQFIYSPGNLTSGNNSTSFSHAGSPGVNARYLYDRFEISQNTLLPRDLSLLTRGQAQVSSANLVGSEQIGFGGANSVRGYNEGAIAGSQGLLLSNELHSPTFSLFEVIDDQSFDDKAQLITFWDIGYGSDNDTLPHHPKSAEIQSVGVGLRWALEKNFDAKIDYGQQLRQLPTTHDHAGFAHMSVTFSY